MYDKSVLLEILFLDECRTLNEDGKAYPPSAPAYTHCANKIRERGFNITPKYIYVIVRENRNRYKDKLQQHFGITLHENINESDETSYSDTVVNTSASSVMLNKKKFDIIVSAEKWRIIKPIRKYITNAYIGFYNPVGRTL